MADIDLFRPHGLGLDGARRAADAVAARLRAEFGVEAAWHGGALHVSGRGVEGQITPTADAVWVRARLGLLARPFRRPLEREIARELDRLVPPPPPR